MKRVEKKSSIKQCLSILILFIDLSSTAEFAYNYADRWPQIYPKCGGQYQSPVSWTWNDIDSEVHNYTFTMVNFNKKPLSAKLVNTGVGLRVFFEWDETQRPFFTDGILGDNEYVLDSMLFHWSRNSRQGAEHCAEDECAPMELQILHYNRKYGSFNNSLNFTDGLVIYCGIIEYKEKNLGASSPPLNYIFSQVGSVEASGSSIELQPFEISSLSKNRRYQLNEHLTYFGSLTMPPCTENVLWLLTSNNYYGYKKDIDFLRSTVKFDSFDQDNIRPIQPLNGRKMVFVKANGDYHP